MNENYMKLVITIFFVLFLVTLTPIISASDGDCLSCHDDEADNKDVNGSSMNISIHANLNNLTISSNLSISPLNKACWACHGNGSAPEGNHSEGIVNSTNPANKTKPLNCNEGKCHVNGTPSGSNINGSPIPIVSEHVPDINISSSINTVDNCNYCHNKSLTPRIDPVNNSIDETVLSNISHYGNTSSLLSNTWDCNLCHKDVGNQWNTTSQIRHPVNKSVYYCRNCHGTGATFHNENISNAVDIHAFGFDWEGDGIDYINNPIVGRQSQDNEGCLACHDNNDPFDIMAKVNPDGSNTVICEECHYNSSVGVYIGPYYGTNLNSRTDIEEAIPRVFNHINDTNATIFIKKMNGTFEGTSSSLNTPSSCFSYNINTGNGSCHGVGYDKRIASGGYYAFNNLTHPADNMSAYRWTMTIDRLPNTSDCRLCHLGINETVGELVNSIYWGNPRNVSATAPDSADAHEDPLASASDCWDCHVAGADKIFIDFHDVNITAGGGPDCISCHDVGSTSATKLVNVAAMNGSLNSGAAIHRAINNATEGGAGGSTGNADNQICWACHQTDGIEPSGMGDKYKNPYKCYECHDGDIYTNVSNAPKVSEHFLGGENLTAANVTGITTNSTSCLVCHNLSEMKVDYNEGIDTYSTNFSIPSHYGRNRSDLRTWTAGDGSTETVNCTYCHSNTTTYFKVAMNDPIGNSNISNHSRYSSTPNCTNSTCHFGGWMHNESLQKPDLTTNESGGAEDSRICLACHSPANASGNVTTGGREKHNGELNCTECHLYVKQDIHDIKYLQNDNTYTTNNNSASIVNCSSCHDYTVSLDNISIARPFIPTATNADFNHSNNGDAGNIWGTTYWSNDNGACEYCHKDTKHSISALGRISNVTGVDRGSTDLDNTTWCSTCHYNNGSQNYLNMMANISDDGLPLPPEITNDSLNGVDPKYFNHSAITSFNDSGCRGCHGQLSAANTSEFPHNVGEGKFGPDCISCHNIGEESEKIDFSVVNNSLSLHQNIQNYGSFTSVSGVNDTNKICWACHMNNGSAPASENDHADRLGDYNNVPVYTCVECHANGTEPYSNITGRAPDVVQHFAGGSNLTAGNTTDNLTSCYNCHNLTEMKLEFEVPEHLDDNNKDNASYLVAHYGKKRSTGVDNIRTWSGGVNCTYCHQTGTNNFTDAMVNPAYNASVPEHSRFTSTPNCTECHNSGMMHDINLTKPVGLTTNFSDGLPSSQTCLNCHSLANASGNVTTGGREKHNSSLNCTECHLYERRDIHGVRYLQSNDIFTADNTSSLIVNCQSCHDYSVVLNNISMSRPFVPTDSNNNFSHSNSVNNGSLWGNYWNNATQACEYCHKDTKHDTSALGSIENITGTPRNSTDLANTTWCRSCHYNDSSSNYLNMMANFTTDSLPTPPEITNGTSWNGTSTGYFNHTISNFNDSGCQACHGQLLSSPASTSEFPHNVGEGQFGPDCISCHDIGGLSPKINFSVMNTSLSLHQNIQNYSSINNPFGVNATNKICWACHMNESESPKSNTSHAERLGDFNGIPVYTCVECHVGDEPNANLSNLAPNVSEHFFGGNNLKAGNSMDNLTSCFNCHNLTEMKLLDIGPSQADDPGNASYLVAHYGKKRSTGDDNLRTWNGGVNCTYCHQLDSAFNDSSIMVNSAFNSSIQDHSRYSSTPNCTDCHNGGWMHNESLQKPDLTTNESGGAEDSRICLECHSPANASGNVTTGGREKHNGSLNCTECHLYVKQDIHGVKYLQSNDNYSIDNTSSLLVNCKICHNYSVSLNNISIPRPFVPTDTNDNFNHSNNASAGQIWGTVYWNNDTQSCEYCHRDSKHNNSALGRLSVITGSALNSTDLANTGWCRSCHYNDSSSNYLNMKAGFTADGLPTPPEITNGTSWNGTSANYFNHTISNYNDLGCLGCHGQLLSPSPSTKEFPHNVGEGSFGPDCISCHDIGGLSPKIDFNTVNDSLSLHQNIQNYSNITSVSGVNDTNKICWACHMDDGQSPPDQKAHADRLGDFNGVPVWTCVECHVGSEPYVNLTGLAPDVFEHFFGGIDLKAGNSADNLSSCLTCHNLSEMKLLDIGPTQADDRTNASYLVAHYGKKRSTGVDNIRTWGNSVNCTYCHQTGTNNFTDAMVNPAYNASVPEHSRFTSTPNCTGCHNSGMMHDINLTKPVELTTNFSDGLPSSQTCLNCHSLANASGNVTTGGREKHNSSLNCTECHLYERRDIHGVKYLQSNDVYTTDNTSPMVINCETCHTYSVILNNISMSRPFVPTDSNNNFNHSDDPDNGSRWANASVVEYWTNNYEACEFCHNDTKHDTNAFGKISFIQSSNSRNQTIDSSSTWCQGCHYQNATNYFVAGNLSKIPPTIFINNTQLTNSTDDVNNIWFNHTLSGYSDDLCKACHGGLLSYGARSTEFFHNVGVGKFGADCVECHALTSPISPDIDIDVLNSSLHTNLNNNSPYTGVLTNDLSKACWACHSDTTDGNPPSVHPFLDIIPPRICEDCHTTIVPSLFRAPLVSEHRPGALDVETNATNASCVKCHNNSVNASKLGWTNISDIDRVSHYGNTDNLLTWVPNGTQDCKYCHYTDSYNISWGYPMDPRITISNLNHSNYNNSPSSACYYCHASNNTPPDFHAESVTGGAGKDCVSCHDIGGAAPTPKWVDVSAMNDSKDIHYDLNRRAVETTTLNPSNVRCWACHGDGDGTDAAQPDGHPDNYRTPKSCSNNNCHAVDQSIFGEPMVYEHFRYVDLIDEDIQTSVDCEVCHKNSLQIHNDGDIKSDSALVSHYGSTRDLINSSSCIYCHLDEDNGEKWGNAPDPTDNETTLSDIERKATIHLGDKWHIGNKYQFYFKDIARNGEAAWIQILHDDEIINDSFIEDNDRFIYTREFLDKDGDEIESVIFSINITAVFRGRGEDSIITIEGRTMKRIHSESTDESCYACHMDNYTRDKSRYIVIDKDDDNTYYTKLYVDFEEDEINQELLAPSPLTDFVIPEGYNQTWTVNGFTFFAKDVHIKGGSVYINLELNDVLVADTVYDEGETIEYEQDLTVEGHTMNEIVLFRADVAKVFTGLEANAVILKNVRIISDKPDLVDNDDEIWGYNASWLQIDDIFSIGGAPDNLHVPPLNDGVDGGPDCVMCHDISAGFGIPSIDAISTQLGGHAGLNKDAYNRTKLTDTIDKACWACHGQGKEPETHPVNYLYPRECQDCHVEPQSPTYGAIDLSDEGHGQVEDCNRCHAADYPGLHIINVFEPLTPYIVRINLDPEVVRPGQSVYVSTAAMSGWNMKVKAIEYFIDIEGPAGTGVPVEPLDGIFNEQVEEAEFIVDTSGMEPGNHTVYLSSMQRDDEWGPVKTAVFSIEPEIPKTIFPWWIIVIILVILGIIGSIVVYKRRQSEQIAKGL